MPATGTPRSASGMATRQTSDRELQRSAATCKYGQAVDRRTEYLGGEHAAVRDVISMSRIDIPNVLLSHGANNPNDRGRRLAVIAFSSTSLSPRWLFGMVSSDLAAWPLLMVRVDGSISMLDLPLPC
jgi:hypothetical protein